MLGRKYLEKDDQSQIRNALNIKIIDIDERSVSRDKLGITELETQYTCAAY